RGPPTPPAPTGLELERQRHLTIQRVTQSMERFHFNTAVAALMELSNALTRALDEKTASRLRCEETFDTLLQLLHPIAPHLTEELWERRGHVETLLESTWPTYDEAKIRRARGRPGGGGGGGRRGPAPGGGRAGAQGGQDDALPD